MNGNVGPVRARLARLISASGQVAMETQGPGLWSLFVFFFPVFFLGWGVGLAWVGVDYLNDPANSGSTIGPATPVLLLIGVPLTLIGIFLLLGVPWRSMVFIGDRREAQAVAVAVAAYPSEARTIVLEGFVTGPRKKLVHVRWMGGRATLGDFETHAGPVTVFNDNPGYRKMALVQFDPHEATDLRTGYIYPFRGPLPAIRFRLRGHAMSWAFESLPQRDEWAHLLTTETR